MLSDSTDPKDISFTRCFAVAIILFIGISVAFTMLFQPQYLAQIMPYATDAIKAVLVLVGANIAKRGIATAGEVFSKKTTTINHQEETTIKGGTTNDKS